MNRGIFLRLRAVALALRVSLCFIALLCVCSFAVSARAAGEYRTAEVESLKITIDADWASQTAPGYLPVRFDITNTGDERTIEVAGQGNRWYGRSGVIPIDVRQSLHLKRGDRVRFTIPAPVFGDNENIQFQIRERGRVLESFNYAGFQSGKSADDSAALIVASPAGPLGGMAQTWLRTAKGPGAFYIARGVTGPGGTRLGPKLDFILEPARMPTNWLGFTSLRAVLIGPKEWEELSPDQKTALLTFAACGGDLMFVDGNLKTVFPEREESTKTHKYFFGQIYFPNSADIGAANFEDVLTKTSLSQDSPWALPANREPDWGWIDERGFRLPIPGVNAVPTGAYMSILVLFSLLIGPANFIFLWRKRQQVLLVLTVPLVSALFIALLAGYAITGEGFGVRARAETFTMLDQASKQAATRASVSLYAAGMSPSGGLRFPRDMAVFAIGTDGRGSTERQSVDLTESQQFSSGIIRARAPSNFEEIGFRQTRERLSFNSEGGRVSVVNGLGANLTRLLYRDHGKVYALDKPLSAGEKGMLQAGDEQSPGRFLADLAKSAPLSSKKLRNVIDKQTDGSYLAVLEHSPFWEPGVPQIDERGSFHLVLGHVEGEP